jgi:ribose 5-phosphate isomerase B
MTVERSTAKRLHVGTDHAGFALSRFLIPRLADDDVEVIDHGAHEFDPDDDYPAPCIAAAEAVVADPGSLGLVLGGSGNGEQMAANLVAGVRAALVWNAETAQLARAHNDANVMALGARQHSDQEALELVWAFLRTPFSGDPRHARRIEQMRRYEGSRLKAQH